MRNQRTYDSHEEQMADEINNSALGGRCLFVLLALLSAAFILPLWRVLV